jgi:hypothetical protein
MGLMEPCSCRHGRDQSLTAVSARIAAAAAKNGTNWSKSASQSLFAAVVILCVGLWVLFFDRYLARNNRLRLEKFAGFAALRRFGFDGRWVCAILPVCAHPQASKHNQSC